MKKSNHENEEKECPMSVWQQKGEPEHREDGTPYLKWDKDIQCSCDEDLGDHMCVSCCGFFIKKEISVWKDEDYCERCFDSITIYKVIKLLPKYRKVKLTGNIREVS